MVNNLLFKLYRTIKQFIVYQPPQGAKPFVLDETEYDSSSHAIPSSTRNTLADSAKEMDMLIAYARRLENVMEQSKETIGKQLDAQQIAKLSSEIKILELQQQELTPITLAYTSNLEPEKRLVSANLDENKKLVETLYHSDINMDLQIREFEISGKHPTKAMLVFLDGMIDKQITDLTILQPLMLLDGLENKPVGRELLSTIIAKCLPSNQAKRVTTYKDVINSVSSGDSALFIEGAAEAVVLSTKGYKQRGVERPQIEQSVRGAQAAFSEGLRTNTGLIRTFLPSNDLVTEIITIGDRVPQKCAVMYLKSLANPELVAEVKRRLSGIKTDYVLNLGILEQFIEDHPGIPFPQMLSTERPDRAAVHLTEGRVLLLYEGVPFGHILPVSLFTFFHSIEDFTLKAPAGKFMRVVRLFGALFSLIIPSLYLAINYFHQEALPTELALAIAGAREKVPFPAIAEIIMMEISFELIREAGLRIPGLLGSTIGIVGAIILGQAAVAANLVSPIVVVLISLTGLASFSIPDYRLAFSLRIIRFIFLALSTTFGLMGLAFGMLVMTVVLCSMKSFGVPYMAPVAPKTIAGYDVVFRGPVFRQENRPDQLNPQDDVRQPTNSRSWAHDRPVGKEGKERS